MNVPKLRFSQFTGEWKEYILGELTDIRSASRVHRGEWCPSGIPFYRSSDVMAALNGTKNEKAYISQELYDKLSRTSGKLEKGDILITGGGSVGVPYIVPDDNPLYTKDADLLWIKKSEHLIPEFLYAYFFTNTYRNYLMSISHVGTIAHYTIEQVKVTPVKIPDLSEQQKIADVFKILDQIIEVTQSEIEAWEKQKRGVMQLLFSQKIRFKADDGSEFPEWEEKTLNEVMTIDTKTNNGSFGKEDILSVSEYLGVVNQIELQGRSFAGENIDNYKIVQKGQIVYTRSPLRDKPYGIIKIVGDVNGIVSPLYIVNNVTRGNDALFVYYYFDTPERTNNYLRPLVRMGAKHTMNISNSEWLSGKVCVPSFSEQQKIAACLSAFDEVIDKTKEELEAYRELKKGLLQQMFV